MTEQDYKRNIKSQRDQINRLKQLRDNQNQRLSRLEIALWSLRIHANKCCTCGNRGH